MLVNSEDLTKTPLSRDVYVSNLQRANKGRHAGRWFGARAGQCAIARLLIGVQMVVRCS
jgi:hypothetical protein